MSVLRVLTFAVLFAGLPVRALSAQGPGDDVVFSFAPSQNPQEAQTQVPDDDWTFLGTAKWAGVAVSGGAAIYGFSLNSQADDIYAQLETICGDDPTRCEQRNPDGSFRDEELEQLYQDTLDKDRQARAVLIVSQVTLAAAVAFFILDLSNRPPENIPYDPPVALQVAPSVDGRITIGARVRTDAWTRP